MSATARQCRKCRRALRYCKCIDARVRRADDGRRADILVSLPAALSPVIPVILTGLWATVTMIILILPVVLKIIRKW